MNRRTRKYVPGTPNSYQHFYYNAAWQILETRESSSSTIPTTAQYQYVWSLRYIDAPILRDTDPSSTASARHYYSTDANFNVTALYEDGDPTPVERYTYDPYGNVTIYDGNWSTTRTTSLYDNTTLYTGQWRDPETGLMNYRNRYYHPTLGRFLTRDPIGYTGDANLYEYIHGLPVTSTDAYGLEPATGNAAGPNGNFELNVVVKTFINKIGDNLGVMPSDLWLGQGKPDAIRQAKMDLVQLKLKAFALVTDKGYNNNPTTDVEDEKYRFRSQLTLSGCCKGNKLTGLETNGGVLDPGREPSLDGVLKVGTVRFDNKSIKMGAGSVSFCWRTAGKPAEVAEESFQLVHERTSKYIWHVVRGKVVCNNGKANYDVDMTGSMFPSHKMWINGKLVSHLPQEGFAGLWQAHDKNKEYVQYWGPAPGPLSTLNKACEEIKP